MAGSPSAHSIESPGRLDFNEDDDDDDLIGDPAGAAECVYFTEAEEAELLGAGDSEAPMIISQDDGDVEATPAVLAMPTAAATPAVLAMTTATAAPAVLAMTTATAAPAVLAMTTATAAPAGLAMPIAPVQFWPTPNENAEASTINMAVGFETEAAADATASSNTQMRRERKRLLPFSGRSPRHSYPPDPNEIIDLTAESSDDEVSNVGKKCDNNNNSNSNHNQDTAQPSQLATAPPTNIEGKAVDLRQVINEQRHLKRHQAATAVMAPAAAEVNSAGTVEFRQPVSAACRGGVATAAIAQRRHSASTAAAPSQPKIGVVTSGATCRFRQRPYPTNANAMSVRPFGGPFSGPRFGQPPNHQQKSGFLSTQFQHQHRHQVPIGRLIGRQSLQANEAYGAYHCAPGANADGELVPLGPTQRGHNARHLEHSARSSAQLDMPSVRGRQLQQPHHHVDEHYRRHSTAFASGRTSVDGRGFRAGNDGIVAANFAAAEEMRAANFVAAGPEVLPLPAPPVFDRAVHVPYSVGYQSGCGRTSVRIENCPDNITEQDLALLTDPLGPVCEYRLMPSTYKAFVKFFNEHQASEFVRLYNRKLFKGSPLYMALIS